MNLYSVYSVNLYYVYTAKLGYKNPTVHNVSYIMLCLSIILIEKTEIKLKY